MKTYGSWARVGLACVSVGLLSCSSSGDLPAEESVGVATEPLVGTVRVEVSELRRDNTFASAVEARVEIFDWTRPANVPSNLEDEVYIGNCQQGSATCQMWSTPWVGRWSKAVNQNQVTFDGRLILNVQSGLGSPTFAFCFAATLDTVTGALTPAPTTPGKCAKITGGLDYVPARDMRCGASAGLPAQTCELDAWISTNTQTGVPWKIKIATTQEGCQPTGIEVCDGIDNNCNNAVDEQFPFSVTCGAAGACAGSQQFTCVNGVPGATACVGVTPPTPELPDGADNDCDGETDECPAGGWTFNVVPGADLDPAPACVPTSVDPNATCSLRGAFQAADLVTNVGCPVTANVAPGVYTLNGELPLSRGTLRLVGGGAESTIVNAAVPAGDCPRLCGEPCANACHPTPGIFECAPGCDPSCNFLRDPRCAQACDGLVRHRLVNVTAAAGMVPSLDVEGLTFQGGRNPRPGASADNNGGGLLIDGGIFKAKRIVVAENWGSGYGVGIAIDSSPSATITDSVIRNNVNEQVGGACNASDGTGIGGGATARGGGIASLDSTTVIERTAIIGNVSSDGGGVYAEGGTLTIRSSTISSNSAPAAAGGILTAASTTLEFNTIAFNQSGFRPGNDGNRRGAGLTALSGASVRAFGNVLAGNFVSSMPAGRSQDCSLDAGVALVRGYNLIQDARGDCAALATARDLTVDPNLVNPDVFAPDEGPSTPARLSYAPAAASPVVDFYPAPGAADPTLGAPACPTHDQRGLLRDAFGCDVGAVETEGRSDGDGDGIADDMDPQPFVMSAAFSDVSAFGVTDGTIVDRGGNVVVIHDGPNGEDGVVVRVAGTGGPATISACGGSVQVTVQPGQSRLITCPRPTTCTFASEGVTLRDRADVLSDLFSGSFTLQIDATVQGDAFSLANGSLGARTLVQGDARLRGLLSGNRAGVQGALLENTTVTAQSLLLRAVTAGGAPVTVAHDATVPLEPGSYGALLVKSRGMLQLAKAGVYRFTSVTFEPDARVRLPGGTDQTVIAASGNVTLGDRLVTTSAVAGTLDPRRTLVYSRGTAVTVGFDIVLPATIEAPGAALDVRDRTTVRGCVGGRSVVVGLDATVGDPTSG